MAEAVMSCHRTVLERCESTPDFERRHGIEFAHSAIERAARGATTGLVLSYETWVDLGKPETVTVAVVAGDELTPEVEAELEEAARG